MSPGFSESRSRILETIPGGWFSAQVECGQRPTGFGETRLHFRELAIGGDYGAGKSVVPDVTPQPPPFEGGEFASRRTLLLAGRRVYRCAPDSIRKQFPR